MKLCYAILILLFAAGCKKSVDSTAPPPPPVPVDPGTVSVSSISKKEINSVEVFYAAVPPTGKNYTAVHLIWSTGADFSGPKDSAAMNTALLSGSYIISKLAQATTYYVRVGATISGQRIYSAAKDFKTDALKIMVLGYSDPPRGFSKDDTSIIFTNLPPVAPVAGSDTKILFGSYECTLTSDQGLTIEFNVPGTIPAGKYKVKLLTRGMEASWPDSVEVLRGRWDIIPTPDIPHHPTASYSALVQFGTCYSATKGFLLGGAYLNGPQVPFPNSQWPEYLMELDGGSKQWTKRTISNPLYFEDPQSYYFNNAVYVIAAHETDLDVMNNFHTHSLKKIHRLDLGSMTWTNVTDVPYQTMINMASFELNNEWYMGMGADSANRSVCCGVPLASKKFWKYNPAANQWTALADFPGGYQVFPTCFSMNGKGYAFYGAIPAGGLNFTQELWEYNPASNSWTAIPLPATGGPPPGEKYNITVYNGKAYFLTAQVLTLSGSGYDYSTLNPCLEWNPVNNTYKKVAFPYDALLLKTVYQQGNKFYYQSETTGYFQQSQYKAFTFEVEQ